MPRILWMGSSQKWKNPRTAVTISGIHELYVCSISVPSRLTKYKAAYRDTIGLSHTRWAEDVSMDNIFIYDVWSDVPSWLSTMKANRAFDSCNGRAIGHAVTRAQALWHQGRGPQNRSCRIEYSSKYPVKGRFLCPRDQSIQKQRNWWRGIIRESLLRVLTRRPDNEQKKSWRTC